MKQIKVSTVKMESNVEVLFVNSAIISKSLKAQIAAEHILEKMRDRNSVRELEEPEHIDDGGNPIPDANGCIKSVPLLDENGKQVVEFDYYRMDPQEVALFYKNIVPMLDELTKAFEE